MNNTDNLFDFDDLLITPTPMSDISSRKEINPKHSDGFYPLMTAPMDTVISEDNWTLFRDSGIVPVFPRTHKIQMGFKDDVYYSYNNFLSYGLKDFNDLFIENTLDIFVDHKVYALIDVANGHMKSLYDMAKIAKEKYGDKLVLMVGNVANPKTFMEYCDIKVDYVRIGIGNGNGCLTTVQTGVGYPMASLIEECSDVKKYMGFKNTKIVADGGFKKYSDVIKGLALGADYIMLGSILNKCLESSGETTKIIDTLGNHEVINQYSEESRKMFDIDIPLYKNFRGMSTKEVQKSWGRDDLKTSEGVVRTHKVEYTIEGWIQNFDHYLRSAMSYTGKKELHDFIGGVDLNFITQNSFRRFDK
jgi:IMP dehydrogenase/GMP reductase